MIELNEDQKSAAEFLHGIASVVAVPGSGKTSTMTARIGNLVKHGVSPQNILGLTFTRNAAQAMRDKLTDVLQENASKVHLSTIHSFCMNLLRSEGRAFEILHGKDQIIFLRKIMKKSKLASFSPGMILREISLAKSNLIHPDDFEDLYQGDESMLKVAEVYQTYEAEKRKRLMLDFDDLLIETYNLLKEDPQAREKYRAIWTHILVDEYQDTNPVQAEILKLLVQNRNGKHSLWITGDDWQSIYSFTGASVGNILNFKSIYPNSSQFILKTNYRSTPQILQASMNLIRKNVRKIDKQLQTRNPRGEEVKILGASDEDSEAHVIAEEINYLVEKKNFSHREIAVLYRANFQSRVVEDAFAQQKIPYHIENGLNFYQRREVKILLDYLRVIHNPDSDEADEALRGILNVPNRYMGRTFLSTLEEYSTGKNIHLWEGLGKMPIALPYVKINARIFVEIMTPLIRDSSRMSPGEIIQILRESLSYDAYIAEDDIPSPDDLKIQNINELQIVAGKFDKIQDLLTYTETFSDPNSNDINGVSLMTIHKAKGLEFKTVFLIGLVDGILPNRMADSEEERRTAFVAMTRAMQLLYLTYSHNRNGRPVKRSPFLDEILDDDIPY